MPINLTNFVGPNEITSWYDQLIGQINSTQGPTVGYAVFGNTGSITMPAAQMSTGRDISYVNMTGALAANATLTTDTAANIITLLQGLFGPNVNVVGTTWALRISNASTGAFSWTVAGGTGVTVTSMGGGATSLAIAQNTWREFLVSVTSATTVTLVSVGTGTVS
jgi:hypothetical protein